MKTQNIEVDYKPTFVSRLAKIIIPLLRVILPKKLFYIAYNNLYLINMKRIWILYSIKTYFLGLFANKYLKEKYSLTRRVLPYTLGGPKALDNAFEIVRLVEKNNIQGAIVECGVAQGGCAAMMALSSRTYGNLEREFWFFDSYEGLPEPTEEDYKDFKTGGHVGVSRSVLLPADVATFWDVAAIPHRLNFDAHHVSIFPAAAICAARGPRDWTLRARAALPHRQGLCVFHRLHKRDDPCEQLGAYAPHWNNQWSRTVSCCVHVGLRPGAGRVGIRVVA